MINNKDRSVGLSNYFRTSFYNNFQIKNPNPHYPFLEKTDSFERSLQTSPIQLIRNKNVISINFAGTLKDPRYPGIQMRVRGVSQHQKGSLGASPNAKDKSVIKLAESNWRDGQKLNYKIVTSSDNEKVIFLEDSKFGEIGRVPDEITPYISKMIEKHPNDFRFELSNVVAGTSKGAATIGLRANLLYTGKDEKMKQKVDRTFDRLLNSDDKEIKDVIIPYQPKASPKEVLQRIFDIEAQKNGTQASKSIEDTIDTIADEINNPNNKNILLIGHCLPDGDTLGCVLGMHAAIKGAYPDRRVDCTVDDKIPGLFRDKMPGIENVKRPFNQEKINELEENIKRLKSEKNTKQNYEQRRIFEKELAALKKSRNLFDPDAAKGEAPTKYDLVILMDIPTPSRFSAAYKDYIENAGKVIYIDHHPYRPSEWNEAKDKTGVDMKKIERDNLSLVCEAVPSATQLVTVVADRAGILNGVLKNNLDYAKQFVASIITGTSTDTGSFIRSANLTPEDIKKPVKERPNFLPEGMSKWLISRLGNKVDKKWLREHIVYDISDSNASAAIGSSPRETMIKYSLSGLSVSQDAGVGFVEVDYDKMYEVWQEAMKTDKKVTLLDVQNSFKYSEVMSALRENPIFNEKNKNDCQNGLKKFIEAYRSPYEDDKIAVLMIQDKKEGCIDEKSNISDKNGIRLSFRSQPGTIYAELLANLFGGGGHGGAAGGRIDLDGVTLNSPLVVKIDGKTEKDPQKIYQTLKENYDINHDSSISHSEKESLRKKISLEIDKNGEKARHIIIDLVREIRKDSDN